MKYLSIIFLLSSTTASLWPVSENLIHIDHKKDVILNNVLKPFAPDIHISTMFPQDTELVNNITMLFCEADLSANKQRDVYKKAVTDYNGQEVILLTQDDVRISCLYFKRIHAPINLIYVPGYFFDLTPTKEWCTPFVELFKDANIVSLDWRGTGDSEGSHSFLTKNSFGTNAYPDIQAIIDFVRKENDKPIILVGFCFGAAMVLHATIKAQEAGKRTADALVLNCPFSTFENQFKRISATENRFFYKLLLNSGIARIMLEYQINGDIFNFNPIDMIKKITIPCYFEHYTHDRIAILEEAIEVYNKAECPKMFMQSDIGRHVRIHSKVPYQYSEAFRTFLRNFNFLPTETNT